MAEQYLAWDTVREVEKKLYDIEDRKSARKRRGRENALNLDDKTFITRYRVSKESFHEILKELQPCLQRQRPYGLSVESQLLTILRFYATGCYQLPIGLQWGCIMSQKSVSRVIHAVSLAINKKLLHKCIYFPNTPSERKAAKEKFLRASHPFPDAIGAIDCSRIKILAPQTNEEAYVCGHHDGHSLNVQVICDPDLLILNINARWPGSRHDAHIWANSPVRSSMKRHIENGDHRAWLLGDDGYLLEPWLMTPIKNQPPGSSEYRYTKAHSSSISTESSQNDSFLDLGSENTELLTGRGRAVGERIQTFYY